VLLLFAHSLSGEERLSKNRGHAEDTAASRATIPSSEEKIVANRADEIETEQEYKPLSGDEFQNVFQIIEALDLTWTEDFPPLVKAKDPGKQSGATGKKLKEIFETYPTFPNELNVIIVHILLGAEASSDIVGTKKDLAKKVAAVSQSILTPSYRHEFFFKRLRLPHFSDVDWDIEMKLFEREIESQPIMPYAIISIDIEESFREDEEIKTITFAADKKRIQKLVTLLEEAKANLEKAHRMIEVLKRSAGE
jgi:COMM domain-containing protein